MSTREGDGLGCGAPATTSPPSTATRCRVAVIATAVAAYWSSGKSSDGVLMKDLCGNKFYLNQG